jgi:DNA polymerase IIIc chi subunit
MRLSLVTAGALLTLAGCATATTTTPVAAPPAATTPATITTPPPLSKPDAAQRYLAIVKPYNVALERLETAINSGQPVATLRTRASELAAANQEQINQLQTTLWPTEIRAPMAELIAESGKSQPLLLQAAQAKTRSQLVQAVVDGLKHDGKTPAKAIRDFLELAKYDERDYGGS